MTTVQISLSFDDEHYHVVSFNKNPKCCIKGCNEYGTHGLCTLRMCKKHHDQARD